MPFFSRFGGGKKDKKKKNSKEEGVASKASSPAPYRHVPTHAYSDSILMCAGPAEETRAAIKEASSRRESMMSSSRNSFSRPHYSRTSSSNHMEFSRSSSYYSLPNSPVHPRESAALAMAMSMPPAVLPRSRSHLSTVSTPPGDPSPSGWAPRAGNPRSRPQQAPLPQLQQEHRPHHRHSTRTFQSLVVPDDAEFQFSFQETRDSSATPSSTSSSTEPSSLDSSPVEIAVKPTGTERVVRSSPSTVSPMGEPSHFGFHNDVETVAEPLPNRVPAPTPYTPEIAPGTEPDLNSAHMGGAVFLDDGGRVFTVPRPVVPPRKRRPSFSGQVYDKGGPLAVRIDDLGVPVVG